MKNYFSLNIFLIIIVYFEFSKIFKLLSSLLIQVEQNGEGIETISMGGGVAQVMLQGGEGAQVLQVLSLKDATVLTKAMVRLKNNILNRYIMYFYTKINFEIF